MDEGPFRMSPRSTDREVANRPEPSRRTSAEEPQPVKEESKPVHRTSTSHHSSIKSERSNKRLIIAIVVAVVIVIAVVGGWFGWQRLQNGATGIDGGKYQAVFFTNGQVYFGKLHTFNNDYMKLTDIYYLQTQTTDTSDSNNPQKTANDNSDVKLIKLGNEIHGPEDEMIIAKSQVLFYENLKSDGSVAKSIANAAK